jgi:4-aminobutyrate aminotransferase / (S)-3-amino-2-methylpropionate transaminase / 5-aminovalerate transaminase
MGMRRAGGSPSEKSAATIMERYKQYAPESMGDTSPLVWERAEGCRVWDADGRAYIDFTSGVLVLNVGHSHPRVTAAIADQAKRFLNCYGATSAIIADFMEQLARLLPARLRKLILLTTGSEAIEAAVRIARAATGRHEILAFSGGFHGRTHMAMTLGGMRNIKEGFGPVAPGVLRVYYPYCYRCLFDKRYPRCGLHCLQHLEHVIRTESCGSIAALLMEPYLGSGGAVAAPREYIQKVRQFCREHNILFILDEVQASFGRTGTMFAFEQLGIEPDLLCLGKGISSGVPMSAVAMRTDLAKHVREGAFGSTYGGFNPLACAAGLATLAVLRDEHVVANAHRMAAYVMQHLKAIQRRSSIIGEVRGMGLSLGVEFVTDRASREPAGALALEVSKDALQNGLALLYHPGGIYGNVLRLMPPLTIDKATADEGLQIFEKAVQRVEQAHKVSHRKECRS